MPAKRRPRKVMAMDPQCGKAVDPSKASRVTWEGKDYFFCSEECRRRFDADPPGDAGF
jgi:Cu+-exporting ATPase